MTEEKLTVPSKRLNARQRLTANLSRIKDVDASRLTNLASNVSNLASFDTHNLSKINPKAAYCTVTEKEVIKYVRTPTSWIKSSLAFIAILVATLLLFWQLYHKILSFATNPVQTASKYDYPNTLPLPGILLCNTEPLKISYVSKTPAMEVFNYFYTGNTTVNSATYAQLLSAANQLDTQQFYANGSVQKEDFILKCTWPSGKTCDLNEFAPVTTDYGNCYGLNLDLKSAVNVTNAGPANGLQITLNIATYESMRGPYNTIGAKIALYPQSQIPVVAMIGLDAPPGFQTSISLSTKESVRLPKSKKGNCEPNASLKLYKKYSYEACRSEQAFLNIQNACGCSAYNTPLIINSSVCSIEQQLGCVTKAMRAPPVTANMSFCTETCQYRYFDTSLSYSLISVDQAVATLSSDQLLAMISGFRNATQLRSTWEAEMRLNFDNKVNSLIAAYSALRSLMLDPISGTFQELQARLTTAVPCYKPDFAKISSISLVPEDLMRKRNSSALQQAKTDVDGIGTKMTKFDFTNLYSAINALAADKNSTTAMTQITSEYQLILDLLNNQQTIIIQTSSTTTSFYNNDQLLTDKQKYFGAVNSSILAVSSDLQQAISNCNTTINSLNILSTTQLNTSTQGLSALISAISGKCNDAVANISNYEIAYTYALKNYSTDLTTIQTFKMDQLSLFSKLNSEQIVTFSDESFQEILQLCQSYIRGDIDKVTLAQQLVDNYANYWLTLQDHFSRLRTQVLSTRITIENFVNRMNGINNNLTATFLSLVNTDYLGGNNETLASAACVGAVRGFLLSFLNTTNSYSNSWSKSYATLLSELTTYISSFQVDDAFYKNNLVMFNIFYGDLSIQKTEQVLMYELQTMISDVAGTIGIIIAFLSTSGVAIVMGCASLGRTLRSKVCPSKQETPAESDKGLDVVQVVEKEQTYTTSQPPPSILTTTTEPPDTQQLAQSAAERTGSTQSKKDRIGSATQPKQERGGSAAVLDTSQSVIIPPSIN